MALSDKDAALIRDMVAKEIAEKAITHPHLKVAEGAGPDPYLTDTNWTPLPSADLKTGDTIIVYWFPYYDTVRSLTPYAGERSVGRIALFDEGWSLFIDNDSTLKLKGRV